METPGDDHRSTSFTTSLRMINRIHCLTANGGSNTAPALRTGFAKRAQRVLRIGYFSEGCPAVAQHLAHLTGTQTQRRIVAFAGH